MQLLSNAIATQTARMGQTGEACGPGARTSGRTSLNRRRARTSSSSRVQTPVDEEGRAARRRRRGRHRSRTPTSSRSICRLRRRRRSAANLNSEQEAEMARLLAAPKVAHKVRFTNKSSYPLTTAPALVVRDNRVLAQGLITYTAPNATSDLEVTKAVDIQVTKSDDGDRPRRQRGPAAGRRLLAGQSRRHDRADEPPRQGGGRRGDAARARQRHDRRQRRRRHEGERVRRRAATRRAVAAVVALVQLAELVVARQRRRPDRLEGPDRAGEDRRPRLRLALLLAVAPASHHRR